MPRKKKSSAPRQRRDPYARAYAAAVKRLDKAKVERVNCNQKLAELNAEIPRLEGIVRVLGPPQPLPQFTHKIGPTVTLKVDTPPTVSVDELPNEEDALLEASPAARAGNWHE